MAGRRWRSSRFANNNVRPSLAFPWSGPFVDYIPVVYCTWTSAWKQNPFLPISMNLLPGLQKSAQTIPWRAQQVVALLNPLVFSPTLKLKAHLHWSQPLTQFLRLHKPCIIVIQSASYLHPKSKQAHMSHHDLQHHSFGSKAVITETSVAGH